MSDIERDVRRRLAAMVNTCFHRDAETAIDDGTRFVEDLAADSLDVVELTIEAEDAFCLSIPDEEAERLATFGQAAEYLARRVRAEATS